MSKTLRFFKINQMLSNRLSVSKQDLLDALEVSWPTLKRDLAFQRDQCNAPIVFNRSLNGYQLSKANNFGPVFQMPGMWLNANEAYALITANSLLESIEPGIVSQHIAPLKERLLELIGRTDKTKSSEEMLAELSERVQVIQSLRHRFPLEQFQSVAYAAINGLRLSVRFNDQAIDSDDVELSPQRITYYRENWFLDAWSHPLNALRTYPMDVFKSAHVADLEAHLLPKVQVDEVLNTGYGAYIGQERQNAVLDFSPDRAEALKRLTWHDENNGTWLENGWYRVSVTYNNDRALIKDILRHCPGILVQEPAALKAKVIEAMQASLKLYQP